MGFHLSLQTESVEHAYPKPPLCLEVSSTVADAVALMNEARRGGIIVVDNEKLVGVFTERDALRMLARGQSLDVPMADWMTKKPITLLITDTVGTAIQKMSEGGYRRLPIIDHDNRPTGAATVSGILHFLAEHFPNIVYNLPPEPHQRTQDREGA